jgi:hypothetical protein
MSRGRFVVSIFIAALDMLFQVSASAADLRTTCAEWPSEAGARFIGASERSSYVSEMTAFLDRTLPRIRAATKAADRAAVSSAQMEICKFNTRWPTKADKNASVAKPYPSCFFATEYAYFLGATLDVKPRGGLDYDGLVELYGNDCRKQLRAGPPLK